ncbi:MAG TPA: OPT/YSL family transporter, partial [Blastocatellia bacterium]|nr:OPT/YSL family transporter [Blastocatellia bacterium]
MAVVEKEVHKPYIPASKLVPEFTPRAIILGILFGLIFGASTVYLGLKVGLTVSASIPIAVLSITILRAFGRASILENNIVQTTGSAGESIAGGIVFTIPALLILGLDLDILRTSLIALTGGLLGVLMMIPLRRSLIVKEHGNLPYPEGTACAEVLEVG